MREKTEMASRHASQHRRLSDRSIGFPRSALSCETVARDLSSSSSSSTEPRAALLLHCGRHCHSQTLENQCSSSRYSVLQLSSCGPPPPKQQCLAWSNEIPGYTRTEDLETLWQVVHTGQRACCSTEADRRHTPPSINGPSQHSLTTVRWRPPFAQSHTLPVFSSPLLSSPLLSSPPLLVIGHAGIADIAGGHTSQARFRTCFLRTARCRGESVPCRIRKLIGLQTNCCSFSAHRRLVLFYPRLFVLRGFGSRGPGPATRSSSRCLLSLELARRPILLFSCLDAACLSSPQALPSPVQT